MIREALPLSPLMVAALSTGAVSGRVPEPWKAPGIRAGEQITGPDGCKLVWVPAGEFVMGSTNQDPDAQADEKPDHLVRMTKGFWLGRSPVTLGQWKAYCRRLGMNPGKATAPGDRHPVVGARWDDAAGYCRSYGLHLPTEAQWEYAARGPEGRKYPWGDAWDDRRCCSATNRGPSGSTYPVGSFPHGVSWCGALDTAGNVWQWCEDWYDGTYYRTLPATDPPGPQAGAVSGLASTEPRRVLKGGAFGLPAAVLRSAAKIRDRPANADSDYGFRVAAPP